MLKPNLKKLLLPTELVAALLVLLVCLQGAAISFGNQTSSQRGPIKDGIGLGEILIGTSTAADVEARHGTKYELKNRRNYSYRMDYTDVQLAFYYCYQDPKKKIFLVEVHDGVTGKGIVIGRSTMKEVVAIYGKKSGGSDVIFEYPGIQFYFEARTETEAKDEALAMNRKVIEVDIVAPDKSSDFCD
ncbi:MAG: hypothetical protein ACREA9_05295 [Pyrinomonadaceae bacterium]